MRIVVKVSRDPLCIMYNQVRKERAKWWNTRWGFALSDGWRLLIFDRSATSRELIPVSERDQTFNHFSAS